MSAVSALISMNEFARRDRCDEKVVRRHVARGILKKINGKLDAALVGSDWPAGNRRSSGPESAVSARVSAVSEVSAPESALSEDIEPEIVAAADKFIAINGMPMRDRAEAEKIKANYDALLRQLEYDTKSGQVVLVEEVARVIIR